MRPQQDVVSDNAGSNYWFGSSVCIAGNMAFIGARNETVNGSVSHGAVYVFQQATSGGWRQVQRILPSDGREGDQFGSSVAVWADTLVITSPNASRNSMTWKGQAYVFSLKNGQWVETAILSLDGAQAFDNFGNSLAVGPSKIFLGAGGIYRAGVYGPRYVHAFEYSPVKRSGGWVHRQTLKSPIPEDETSSFGASLAFSGDTLFVGARAATFNSQPGRGAVYVYGHRNNAWEPSQRLIAKDGLARDNFGTSIAFQGDVAVVGAPGANLGSGLSQGAAYVFRKRRGRWEESAKIKASDSLPSSLFGASVSLYEQSFNDKRLLIGAYGADSYKGAAYLFHLGPTEWREVEKLVSATGQPGDVFGYYTAVSESTALVGSYTASVDGYSKAGKASFFPI